VREQIKLAAFASGAMLVLSGVMTGLSASLVDMATELGLETTRAGLLYTIHFVGFMTFVLLSLAVHGLRARLLLTTAAAGLYMLALGLSASARVLPLAGLGLFLAGGCGGILESHTATMQVITARSESEAGRVISITQVFFAVGALLAPLYLSVQPPGSWRGLFRVLACIAAVTMLLGSRIREARFDGVHVENGALDMWALLRVSLALAFYVGAEVTLFGWIPTVMEHYRGIPPIRARLSPSVFWLGILGGRLLTARLTSRFPARSLLVASSTLGILSSLLVVAAGPEWLLWIAVVLAALAASGIWPLVVATSTACGHETGTTITIAAGGLGAAVFPYIAGRTAELLPGRAIPLIAAPLFLAVLLLAARAPKRAEDVPACPP